MSPAHLPVYGRDGQRVALMQVLREQPWETSHTIDVHAQASASPDAVRGYIHAYRLSEEQANVARQRLRAQSRKKGRTPKDTTLFWAGWVLVFTTVAPSRLGAKTISALYRVRWQIEIAIKRWKSVLDGNVRAREGSPLAEVWWLGKLLYALVVERRARRQFGADWGPSDEERRGTFWRVWKLIQDEVGVHVLGVEAWREEGWEACMKVIMERPRRRKLQRLPDEVIDMYHGLPTSDQEELGEAAGATLGVQRGYSLSWRRWGSSHPRSRPICVPSGTSPPIISAALTPCRRATFSAISSCCMRNGVSPIARAIRLSTACVFSTAQPSAARRCALRFP